MKRWKYLLLFSCWSHYQVDSSSSSSSTSDNIKHCISSSPLRYLVFSSNDFGSQLFKILESSNQNVFFSPFNIFLALAMILLGAKGDTARQIEGALQLKLHGMKPAELPENIQRLLRFYNGNYTNDEFIVSNSLFLQRGYKVKPEYVSNLKNFYMAPVTLVDFTKNITIAKDTINHWITMSTKNNIKTALLRPLPPSTVLALFDVVFFKGKWQTQFEEHFTRPGNFYRNSTDVQENIQFMKQRKVKYRFYKDPILEYSFLEIPYTVDEIVMLLALPDMVSQPANLEMNSTLLCLIDSNLRITRMDKIMIPKFHMVYEKNLNATLDAFQVKDMFSPSANLSGISEVRDLRVSEVIHKAVITIDERGTEAAAVTGTIQARAPKLSENLFIANHPFLFHIIDKKHGLVIFAGRFANP